MQLTILLLKSEELMLANLVSSHHGRAQSSPPRARAPADDSTAAAEIRSLDGLPTKAKVQLWERL